jgi:uncharacterized protein YjbJ (UPF0337 family)
MNTNQLMAAFLEFFGKVQRKIGEIVGSTDLQVKGLLREAEGKVYSLRRIRQ